jgi:fumarate hydratase class II
VWTQLHRIALPYADAAKAAKKAHKEGTTLKQAAISLKLLTGEFVRSARFSSFRGHAP